MADKINLEGLNKKAENYQEAVNKLARLFDILKNNSYKTFRNSFKKKSDMGDLVAHILADYETFMPYDSLSQTFDSRIKALTGKDKDDAHKIVDIVKTVSLEIDESKYKNACLEKYDIMLGVKSDDIRMTTFGDIHELLESGMKSGRGSSKAYEEIKADIVNLANLQKSEDFLAMDEDKKRILMSVLTKAVIDKADKYISDRSEVEKSYGVKSYKGKRVNIMRRLRAHLQACAENYMVPENERIELSRHEKNFFCDQFKNALRDKTFNARIFSADGYLSGMNSIYNGNYNVTTDGLEENYNSKLMQAFKKSMEGEKLAPSVIDATTAMINAYCAKADKAIKNIGINDDAKEMYEKMLKYRKNYVTREKITRADGRESFRDNEKTTFDGLTITGYNEIDNVVANMVYDKLNHAVKINNVAINR